MELIQLNKFSNLHDEKKIIFCKTDFLLQEFENIKKINNDIILITGNSDYPILDNIIELIPKNVKKWYGQNILTYHEKIEPIPMGIENRYDSVRSGHGIGYYERVEIKESLLKRNTTLTPTKKIYSNFQINTNYTHRQKVKSISIESPHIDWEEPNLSLEGFFNKILDYEMVVCPAGNGVDTHRLWEVLYSNRIPITVKIGDFKIYELYNKLPIVVLENIDDLLDLELIYKKYNQIKINYKNIGMIDFNYWKNKILESI